MNMSRFALPALCLVCCQAGFLIAQDAPRDEKLTPALVRKVQETVIDPFEFGDPARLIAGVDDLLKSTSPKLLDGINRKLQEGGYPTLEDLAGDACIQAIEQGWANQLPALKWNLARVVLPNISNRISTLLSEQDRHPLMQNTIAVPESYEAYEAGLWDLHVFDKQLRNAMELSRIAHGMSKPFKQKFEELAASDSSVDVDFESLSTKIGQQQHKRAEREAEVRYYRIEDAAQTLAESKDFEQRIRAAFALEYDALALFEFFQSYGEGKTPIKRVGLKAPELPTTIDNIVKQGRTDGADVIRKATLLNVGLHWWTRGRYGAGPLRNGLLKSPQALQSAAAQFPLYMPVKPSATDPDPQTSRSLAAKSPQYDRRHHYIWAIEYRPIQTSVSLQSSSSSDNQTGKIDPSSLRIASGSFW